MTPKETVTVERQVEAASRRVGYLVVSAQNILKPAVNDYLTENEVQELIDRNVTVNIKRRS